MTHPSRSAIRSLILAALTVLAATAHAAPDAGFRCRETINKEYTKYVKAITKINQKCNDAIVKAGNGSTAPGGNGGNFAPCDTAGKIPTALQKMTDKITGRCDAAGIMPADIGWPGTCPNFEAGSCTNAIANAIDIATCLNCIGTAAVAQAMDLYYLSLTNGGTSSDLIKCQTTIGRETSKFLTTKDKILGKCSKQVDKGNGTLPCPVPGDGKAGPAIIKAESRKVSKICKACDTDSPDGLSCSGQTFSPTQIGFDSVCPSVTVPGGPACGGPITTLNDLVHCVDCVTEFKVDCANALSRPDQIPYPSGCLGPTPTPTPTAPVCPMPTDATPTPTCVPSPVPTGACPTTFEFTANGSDSDLDIGWSGLGHDNQLPTMGRLTFTVSGCAGGSRPCGQCALAGPIANAGGTAFQNQRCVDKTWIQCSSDADCTTAGATGPCHFFFSPPAPFGDGGISFCLTTEIRAPIAGTVDVESGSWTASTALALGFNSGETIDQPCPTCTAGVCSAGPRSGMPCTVNGQSAHSGDVSFDCPPEPGALIGRPAPLQGPLPIAMTLGTGTQAESLSAQSPNCRAPGSTGFKCLCDTCNDANEDPCMSNADCPPSGGNPGICGGRRCRGGSNNGVPCSLNSECPGGGSCGIPGEQTKPNDCLDLICTPNTPPDDDSVNEGACATAGPNESSCAIEAFRGCSTNADCPMAGDTCMPPKFRECFTDNGVLSTHCFGGANAEEPCASVCDCPDHGIGTFCGGGSVSVGNPDAALCAAPTRAVGALFCVPSSAGAFVNAVGLPGPARLTLPGVVRMSP